jgi:ABC-type multidrug transport system fused ATPase/permease subunit
MARCLLQNAPVVVMDEATSSIDPQSEEILVRATNEFFRGKTMLIIAHRLSTLMDCDRVLWLDQGRVRAVGPTDAVLREFQNSNLSHYF